MQLSGEGTPCRGNRYCKGPEVGMRLMCLRTGREARVAEAGARGKG